MIESRFYMKLQITKGSVTSEIYAPFVCDLPVLSRLEEQVVILSMDRGSASQGLYYWNGRRWTLVLEQKYVSDAIKQDDTVHLMQDLPIPVAVEDGQIVYRNGALVDLDEIPTDNSVYAVITPFVGGSANAVLFVNEIAPDEDGNVQLTPANIGAVGLNQIGVPNGIPSLDSDGLIPIDQLPPNIGGGLKYQGTYDAANDIPPLPVPSEDNKGWYWVVTVAGTQQGLDLKVRDWIVSNGTSYDEVDNQEGTVLSVNGIEPDETGNVEVPMEPGPPGPANTLSIGSVTTGEVDVQITGTAPSQQLHFVLPEGQQGDPGPPNTLTVGTVTSGPTAQVTITNTAPNQTISFVLPKGDPGESGIADAPQDGTPYARQDAGWVPSVPIVGGLIPVEFIDPSLIGTPSFIDSWDADTNTPAVPAASTIEAGRYYIVSVAGATDLDGITTWGVGDLVISTGTAWKRIPSNAALGVTTINGKTGSVVNLVASDIPGISEVGKTGQWDDIQNKPLRVYNISAAGIFQNGDQIGILIADREITLNTSNTTSTIVCNPGAPGIITGKVIHGVTEVGWTIPNTATAGAFDSAVDITLQAGEFLLFTMDTSLVTPLALGFMLKEVEI